MPSRNHSKVQPTTWSIKLPSRTPHLRQRCLSLSSLHRAGLVMQAALQTRGITLCLTQCKKLVCAARANGGNAISPWIHRSLGVFWCLQVWKRGLQHQFWHCGQRNSMYSPRTSESGVPRRLQVPSTPETPLTLRTVCVLPAGIEAS
eukprot:scaffold115565_cov34-Prasinocladus_malaysianus.AAC.1